MNQESSFSIPGVMTVSHVVLAAYYYRDTVSNVWAFSMEMVSLSLGLKLTASYW